LGACIALGSCALTGTCSAPACRDDRTITQQVQAALAKQPDLQAPNQVYVQTRHHVVYLSGLVDTPFQRQAAESLAASVPGVTRVANGIGLSGNAH
jgi:osmotically-inducible protein OsmY